MKTWKEGEKRLTAWLNKQGLWRAVRKSRALRGDAVEDIEWGPLSIEQKSRRAMPQYIKDWMAQAEKNAEVRMPIVVWHENHMRMGKQFVVITLSYLIALVHYILEEGIENAKGI